MKKLIFLLIIGSLLMLPATVMAKKTVGNVWSVPGDFATIQEAIDSDDVVDGDSILVGPGNFAGAFVTKGVEIRGLGGAVIDDGPELGNYGLYQGFRILAGGDGAVISHLHFTVDFPVMNEAANDVTVTHCTMVSSIQGVSNWGGSGWTISHNEIIDLRTRNGGGIGILVGDRFANEQGVRDNVISHNKISGTLHVYSSDGGGYNGTGIVLYADFRWGRSGAVAIADNQVTYNKISLVSDTPEVVDVAAIELTDTRNDDAVAPVIFDNAVRFNDFRGTELDIMLTPASLANVNDISRNLGDNRGHGPHLPAFAPGD
jgi:hypothetical protein